MDRRKFLQGAASLLPAGGWAAPARPPNLLFILADQWRAQTLVSSGDPDLIAPNLAAVARQGVHFDRAYVSNPVCSPSRASILTGRYPHACGVTRNNVLLPLEEQCVPEQLRRNGYSTGYIGKWHLDGEAIPGFVPPGPRRRGFDYWAAFNRGHNYYSSTYFGDSEQPLQKGGFEPDYQTDLAIDFIGRHKDRPFCLFLSWGPPHTPRKPPPRHQTRYAPGQFRLRANVPAEYAAQARRGMAGYYGLCTALDDNVGRLLEALQETGTAEDTLLVFTADHGDMLGSHGLEYKGVPFEESTRVPLLMRYPRRIAAGRSSNLLVSNVDLAPTLLSICGAPQMEGSQGRDLSQQVLTGQGDRPELIYTYGRLGSAEEWRMIVRGYDKLVVDKEMKPVHLYNLSQDPHEMHNLAADPGYRRKRDEMHAVLSDWRRRIGDGMDPSGLRRRD